MPIYGNALIHRSRNQALVSTRPDADVLFVDDDMLPLEDALLRLVAHGRPVVSALCTTRIPPIQYAFKLYDEPSDQFIPVDRVRLDRMITGQFSIGFGFLLVSREAIGKVIEHHLSGNDWLTDSRRKNDRLHVRAEWREKERARIEEIRRTRHASEKYLRVFRNLETDEELELGEDTTFSRRLIQVGIPVSIDTGTVVGHMGEHPFGPWDIEEEQGDRSGNMLTRE